MAARRAGAPGRIARRSALRVGIPRALNFYA
jgi:hypothetical protein